jgi:hypothetical protein
MSTHRNLHIPVLVAILLAIFMAFMGQQYLSDEELGEGCRVTPHGHVYCLEPAGITTEEDAAERRK